MYAIVEIAGHQYKVRKDQQLYVNRLEGKEGSKLSFDKILLTDDNGKVEVGAPVISGIKVDAKIVEHLKADKVMVFKKKRRKGYQKLNGHRQHISLIEITGIGKGTASKTTAKKADEKPAEEKAAKKTEARKTETKKTASKDSAKSEAKKPSVKKTAAKTEAKKQEAPKKKAATKKEDDKS